VVRDERRRALNQNFLVDPGVIEALVRSSGVSRGDLVLDIGAGSGLITLALLRRGARVIAMERDAELAARLRAKCDPSARDRLTVVSGDVLTLPLPREHFQVVANIPFGITTGILHRLLDDPAGTLTRADVIVQAEVARKRGTDGRGTLLNACWEPWFELRAGARVPATAFRPRPRVDAAVLIARRRDEPILAPSLRRDYTRFVTATFKRAKPSVLSAVGVPRARFAEVGGTLGFRADVLPSELSVEQWAGLFRAMAMKIRDGSGRRRG